MTNRPGVPILKGVALDYEQQLLSAARNAPAAVVLVLEGLKLEDSANSRISHVSTSKSAGRVVAAATGLMIFTILMSRILGFVRESLLMYYFGQGALTDVYKQSFRIPDLLFFLIAGGALSSAFIPVFTKYLTEGNEEDAWKTFSVVGTLIAIVATGFVVLSEIYSLPLARLVSPGMIPAQVEQVAYLTRIILPAQIFFFLGGLMMGTLYSRNKFLAPAFGPFIYTIGIIAGGLITAHIHKAQLHYLHSDAVRTAMEVFKNTHSTKEQIAEVLPTVKRALKIGTPVVSGYSWGALIGAFIGNFCVQIIAMRRLGKTKFKPSLDVAHVGAKKVFALMLPVILGLSLPQVDVIICGILASYFAVGSITAVDNANRLMQVPYGVLGTAFAIALLPTLSALAAQSNWSDFRVQVSQGIRRVVFMALPASMMMIVLAIPCVRLVFQHGKLVTAHDTMITATTLILFCSGIFAWCMQAIIARAFYAMLDTLTVVVTGTIMTIIFVGMGIAFIRGVHEPQRIWWSPAALALMVSVSAELHAFILLWLLRGRIGGINGRAMLGAIAKMFLSCAVMMAVTIPIWYKIEHLHRFAALIASGHEVRVILATALEIAFVGSIGLAIYALMSKLFKLEELDSAVSMVRGRFGHKKAGISLVESESLATESDISGAP